jgi:hypothetical protein
VSTVGGMVTLWSFAFAKGKLRGVNASGETRTCITLPMVYMLLGLPLRLVLLELSVSLPGVILVMVNMALDFTAMALCLRGSTHHVFPLVVVVVLQGDKMLWISLTQILSRWLNTGNLHVLLTPVLRRLLILSPTTEQVGGLENVWLIDSRCSRHMTGDDRWFSSLTPVMTKEHITFGDNSKGKVVSKSAIRVSEGFILKQVALVKPLDYNLLSVSQLLDEGFEVRFKRGASRILDSQGKLVCMIIPEGQIFRANFPTSFGSS